MKFSAAIMTSVLATALCVSAAPLQRRAGIGVTKQMGTTRLDASGAVYCEYLYRMNSLRCLTNLQSSQTNLMRTKSSLLASTPTEHWSVSLTFMSDERGR